eukprot:XP_011457050.1 PREDICTED: beta-microseminoprotein-like [Crassostrea gigas]
MERLILFIYTFSVFFVYSEAACSTDTGNGYYCRYKGRIILPGRSYERTTGPNCFKCTCSEDGTFLSCCDTSTIITSFPQDKCKVILVGCDEKAVSKFDESKPCPGPISAIKG